MSDTELLDFMDRNGVQIWPQRKSKHGPIIVWWVQNPTPFFQTWDSDLRRAITRLSIKLSENNVSQVQP